MNQPEVTVLMTVYNGGVYLKSAIESILQQSYGDFELLVIDDKSADNSVRQVRSFADGRIRCVVNERNMGQTRSLNKGLRLAQGRYIARMDADDQAGPEWLREQMDFLRTCPECAVVSTGAAVIDEEGCLTKTLNTPRTQEDIILKSLVASPINHVGAVMSRAAVLKMGGYDEDFKIAADYDLWSRLIRAHYKLACTAGTGVLIRHHRRSLSQVERRLETDFREVARIMRQNIAVLTGRNLSEEETRLLWRWVYRPEALSWKEIGRGRRLVIGIYRHVKDGWRVSASRAQRMAKDLARVVRAKKLLALWPGLLSFYRRYTAGKARRVLRKKNVYVQ